MRRQVGTYSMTPDARKRHAERSREEYLARANKRAGRDRAIAHFRRRRERLVLLAHVRPAPIPLRTSPNGTAADEGGSVLSSRRRRAPRRCAQRAGEKLADADPGLGCVKASSFPARPTLGSSGGKWGESSDFHIVSAPRAALRGDASDWIPSAAADGTESTSGGAPLAGACGSTVADDREDRSEESTCDCVADEREDRSEPSTCDCVADDRGDRSESSTCSVEFDEATCDPTDEGGSSDPTVGDGSYCAACGPVDSDGSRCDLVDCDGSPGSVEFDEAARDSTDEGGSSDLVVCDGSYCEACGRVGIDGSPGPVEYDESARDSTYRVGGSPDPVEYDESARDSTYRVGGSSDRVGIDGSHCEACDRVGIDGSRCDLVVTDGSTGPVECGESARDAFDESARGAASTELCPVWTGPAARNGALLGAFYPGITPFPAWPDGAQPAVQVRHSRTHAAAARRLAKRAETDSLATGDRSAPTSAFDLCQYRRTVASSASTEQLLKAHPAFGDLGAIRERLRKPVLEWPLSQHMDRNFLDDHLAGACSLCTNPELLAEERIAGFCPDCWALRFFADGTRGVRIHFDGTPPAPDDLCSVVSYPSIAEHPASVEKCIMQFARAGAFGALDGRIFGKPIRPRVRRGRTFEQRAYRQQMPTAIVSTVRPPCCAPFDAVRIANGRRADREVAEGASNLRSHYDRAQRRLRAMAFPIRRARRTAPTLNARLLLRILRPEQDVLPNTGGRVHFAVFPRATAAAIGGGSS